MSTPVRRYYRGHTLAAMRDVWAGSASYYHFNHQGTTQCLSGSAGDVTGRFSSDSWGVEAKLAGSTINRHWYVGNLGYYRGMNSPWAYVRARWLRSMSGSWFSEDPIASGAQQYLYAENNPAARVEPSGLACMATLIHGIAHGPAIDNHVSQVGPYPCCLCFWDVSASWSLQWAVDAPRGGKPSDCWIEQFWSRCDLPNHWFPDVKTTYFPGGYCEGGTYPFVECNPSGNRYACRQEDDPGIHGRHFCPWATQRQCEYFITCLCGTEGPIKCYKWKIDLHVRRCKLVSDQMIELGEIPAAQTPGCKSTTKPLDTCHGDPYWLWPI